MNLIKKTTIGIIWSFGDQIARRGVSVFVTLLLARFLAPEEYGLVAMMSVFLVLGQTLMDSGFTQALIRKKNVTQVDYSTVFYANIALGLISYTLLFVLAPLVAQFYDNSVLIPLIRVASLAIIISSFQTVQAVHFTRMMNFKVQVQTGLPANLLSGILAIYMAYVGFGVWALVSQMLCGAFLKTVFIWRMQKWWPSWQFDKAVLKDMYSFGYKLFFSSVLDTVFANIYVIIIAKMFTASIIGLYFFANKIRELVIYQLVISIQSVTYPALSTMQQDDVRLKSAYKKVIVVVSFILFPVILFFAVLVDPLFHMLLPSKWLPAVPYLQLMCIASVLYPLHAINLNILKVRGRSDLFLYIEILKKIMIGFILLMSVRYGIHGILIGQIVSSVLAYVPNSYFSKKELGYSITEQFKDFMPSLLLSFMIAMVGYVASPLLSSELPILIVLIVGGGMSITYLLFAWLFKFAAIILVKEMLMQKLKKKTEKLTENIE